MPGWLERAKNDYLHRRLSRHDLEEIHDAAVKAAIKDQETAGVDIISDGELRRDNMIDHFTTRLPGVQIDHTSKKFYYDFYDAAVRGRLPTGVAGPRRGVPLPPALHRAPRQGLRHRSALASSSASGTSTTRARRRSPSTSPAS